MDIPSTSRQSIEEILEEMASPREQIIPDDFTLTDQDLYGILTEDLEANNEWEDIQEEVVVTTEDEDTQQINMETVWMAGNPTVRNTFPFIGTPGIKQPMIETEPIDYFNLLFNTDFFTLLLTCTNANGEKIKRNANHPHSRFNRWKNTTVEELKVFIGLILLMGIIKLNRVTDYWSKHYLLDVNFSNYMSRNRFFLILRALNVQTLPGNQSLNKVYTLIETFNKTMENLYYPTKEMAIDESLILWKGRLRFRQYIKNKAHKYGIKLYMLADHHGICMKIHLYAGSQDLTVGGRDHVKKVIRLLVSNYLNNGHSLYVDNYYSSLDIAEELLNKNMHLTGTLQFNRKGNPKEVMNARLQPTEACIMHNNKNITVTKWRDKREIAFISTEHDSQYVQTRNKYGNISFKPAVQVKYNKFMRAVDKHDQMLSYYCAEHKTLRWYKKVIIHIIEMNVINAFLMYNINRERKSSLYDFRFKIIEYFLPKKPEVRPTVPGRIHLPAHLPKRNGRTIRKRCRQCYVSKRRVEVLFGCPDCPGFPGLCLENCFRIHHNY